MQINRLEDGLWYRSYSRYKLRNSFDGDDVNKYKYLLNKSFLHRAMFGRNHEKLTIENVGQTNIITNNVCREELSLSIEINRAENCSIRYVKLSGDKIQNVKCKSRKYVFSKLVIFY